MALTITVPTYRPSPASNEEEYGAPHAYVGLDTDNGLNIVLAGKPADSKGLPKLVIERRRNGWIVFILPDQLGDETGYLYIHDDGRIALARNKHTAEIECPPTGEMASVALD